MHQATSVEHYRELKAKANLGGGLVVHFHTSWCEPCAAVTTLLDKLARSDEYGAHVLFAEVDAEKHAAICGMEGVESVPYIAFFRTAEKPDVPQSIAAEGAKQHGQPDEEAAGHAEPIMIKFQERVGEVVGAKLESLEMNILSIYGQHGTQRSDFASLDDYLRYLTTRKGIVLFITGTPSRPRCGFTGKLCELMNTLNARYIYYDVMASHEVCEGLKTYARWPTYPQLYVDGELVGGLDICKELHESEELKGILKL